MQVNQESNIGKSGHWGSPTSTDAPSLPLTSMGRSLTAQWPALATTPAPNLPVQGPCQAGWMYRLLLLTHCIVVSSNRVPPTSALLSNELERYIPTCRRSRRRRHSRRPPPSPSLCLCLWLLPLRLSVSAPPGPPFSISLYPPPPSDCGSFRPIVMRAHRHIQVRSNNFCPPVLPVEGRTAYMGNEQQHRGGGSS